MIVGTIGYATNSGLGVLIKAFVDNGLIQRVLEVRHPTYTNQPWYKNGIGWSQDRAYQFLKDLDTLVIFENAFHYWPLVKRAKQLSIRIVSVPMYEYSPYPPKVEPDLYVCVSDLDAQYYSKHGYARIDVPVDVPWGLRKTAKVFVHNAGHGGHGYRNGTPDLIEAMPYVKSPIELIIRAQPESKQMTTLLSLRSRKDDPRIRIELKDIEQSQLWHEGDVFIFPESFNGLSLPLQEAYAAGMMVMCGARFPMTQWLPEAPMIPVKDYVKDRIAVHFDRARYDPVQIAQTIDWWYERDIEVYSHLGRHWAEKHSWAALKPQWESAFRGNR